VLIINLQCIGFSFIGFFFFLAVKLKPMYCDRSALFSKSYKSHSKTFENKLKLAVAFFAFWAIIFFAFYRFL